MKSVFPGLAPVILVLVGISMSSTLPGLFLPWIQRAREAGRRSTCTYNQMQAAQAMSAFDGKQGYLPGASHYQSLKPGSTTEVQRSASFVFALLPHLDQADLAAEYGTNGPRFDEELGRHLKVMTCPNDSTAVNNGAQISFVVNAGRQDFPMTDHSIQGRVFQPGAANMAHGAVVRHTDPTTPADARSSLAYIQRGDGTATTVLLAENIDAGSYNDGDESLAAVTWDLGAYQASAAGEAVDPGYAINGRVGERSGDIRFPRPSSYHGGGVLVAFADGHVQFLDENISYRVYCQLLTSHGGLATDDQGGLLQPVLPELDANAY